MNVKKQDRVHRILETCARQFSADLMCMNMRPSFRPNPSIDIAAIIR